MTSRDVWDFLGIRILRLKAAAFGCKEHRADIAFIYVLGAPFPKIPIMPTAEGPQSIPTWYLLLGCSESLPSSAETYKASKCPRSPLRRGLPAQLLHRSSSARSAAGGFLAQLGLAASNPKP